MGILAKQKESGILLGKAYKITDSTRKIHKLFLSDKDRTGHFWCFGTTRVGKTRLLSNMVTQDIENGRSVIVIDPKGDLELFNIIANSYLKHKKEYDFVLVMPVFPEYSDSINPLADYYMPEELVGHIVSGVEVGKEPFFFNVAYEISLVMIQSLLMLNKTSIKLIDIKNKMTKEELIKLQESVTQSKLPGSKQLASDIAKIVNSPTDYYAKISSSLRVALTELTSGNIGQIIGQSDSNRFIKNLENNKKMIMLVNTGSMLTRKASFTLSKVIVSMIHSFVGRIFTSGHKVKNGLSLFIDEAQSVIYQGFEDLLAKAGGGNIAVHGFCQSINQIYATIGKDRGKSVLDNTNTKLFMRVPDSDTAKYVAQYFGSWTKNTPIMSSSGTLTTRTADVDYVKEDDVLSLKQRVFYMTTYSGKYKGKTMDVKDSPVNIKIPRVTSDRKQQ